VQQFEFIEPTAATLMSVKPTTEKDGDDEVFAIVLGLSITGPNALLDKLSPTLRTALYKLKDENQTPMPGVEAETGMLRVRGIDIIHFKGSLVGWTLTVDHGIDEEDPIALGDCLVENIRVRPLIGVDEGKVTILVNVRSNDIDAEEAGLVCSHLRHEVQFTLTAPVEKEPKPGATPATGAEIDGSKGHPGAAEGQGSLLDTGTPEGALASSLAGDGAGGPDDDTPADEDEGEGSAPDAESREPVGAAE
jgi:hypothetical protein